MHAALWPQPSMFDNSTAEKIARGDTIVERSERGKVTRRAEVTGDTVVSPQGCRNKVHVTVKGGTVWCYDFGAPIEIE